MALTVINLVKTFMNPFIFLACTSFAVMSSIRLLFSVWSQVSLYLSLAHVTQVLRGSDSFWAELNITMTVTVFITRKCQTIHEIACHVSVVQRPILYLKIWILSPPQFSQHTFWFQGSIYHTWRVNIYLLCYVHFIVDYNQGKYRTS